MLTIKQLEANVRDRIEKTAHQPIYAIYNAEYSLEIKHVAYFHNLRSALDAICEYQRNTAEYDRSPIAFVCAVFPGFWQYVDRGFRLCFSWDRHARSYVLSDEPADFAHTEIY